MSVELCSLIQVIHEHFYINIYLLLFDLKILRFLLVSYLQLRTEVRNPWAHCNFNEWEAMKYLSSIQLMKQFIKHLQMPSEVHVLDDLTHWEVNGTVYFMFSGFLIVLNKMFW